MQSKSLKFYSFFLLLALILLTPRQTNAYGECSDYGVMSYYDSISDKCKCLSGYIFDSGILGDTQCVSASSVCTDKYGYGAEYDSLSRSCECRYGYIFGKDSIGRTQCITEDSMCTNQLGYNSKYNSLINRCQCRFGYVIDGGKCTDGDQVCRNKHGLYSSYSDYDTSCKCDTGYTFNDSDQCVKKQNNVYFYLKELETSNREAIIKSEYDNDYYHVNYGIGCLGIYHYLNKNIVVNLGTDYDLDSWDKIVLQDDNETCNVVSRERVDSDFTLLEEESSSDSLYVPMPILINKKVKNPVIVSQKNSIVINEKEELRSITASSGIIASSSFQVSSIAEANTSTINELQIKKDNWLKRIWKFIWRF